jgi:cytochrome P450
MTLAADTGVRDEEITSFFAADPATIAWPYPMYERWRAGTGVLRWHGGPATLITRYADVKDVMSGKYPIRQNAYRFGELAEGTISRLPVEQHEIFFQVLDFESLFLSRKDGEEHLRLRRIASRAFTARRIELLRASVQRHVDDLVEEMRAEPQPDVKQHIANKLPVRVIVDLIGIPQSDRDLIWSGRRRSAGCSRWTRGRCARPTRRSTPSASTWGRRWHGSARPARARSWPSSCSTPARRR